ncbi:hypothetical protein PHYPSEUDO_003655 [Phytophthora pseudosyringae]|uniref:Uncharacterized protein n=1 Tax=Phytophthora pseudosyringae TaxID=221518 RepID=A0A8T1VPY3_9STRA|nr:hypothetical protein PHYPSEUDO_003655 [Phytophthora pseudosyringae]
MGIAAMATAFLLPALADAQGKSDTGITFSETIEHLGGMRALGGAVLLLALVYVALVEWLLPRGRRLHARTLEQRRTRGGAAEPVEPRRSAGCQENSGAGGNERVL